MQHCHVRIVLISSGISKVTEKPLMLAKVYFSCVMMGNILELYTVPQYNWVVLD